VISIHKSRHCSFDRLGKSDRESKHQANCPLDYDMKMRLQRAALEADVKITVIMEATGQYSGSAISMRRPGRTSRTGACSDFRSTKAVNWLSGMSWRVVFSRRTLTLFSQVH